jgi:hypothetical protein
MICLVCIIAVAIHGKWAVVGWSGWAQTAGYGRVPNEKMPNTFTAIALDLTDNTSRGHPQLAPLRHCCRLR